MNPYNILNIDQNVTSRDIIQAVARAMRERKYSGKEIAAAQKKLMDPVSRAAHEFMYFIDVSPFLKAHHAQFAAESKAAEDISSDDIAYLSVWDEGA